MNNPTDFSYLLSNNSNQDGVYHVFLNAGSFTSSYDFELSFIVKGDGSGQGTLLKNVAPLVILEGTEFIIIVKS